MVDEKRPLRYWIIGENWSEGWFFLSLLAGILLGVPGVIGCVVSYFGLRAVGSTLPRPLAAAAAIAVGIMTIMASQALLNRLSMFR